VAPASCGTSPCIDPIFGPTKPTKHWSATTYVTAPTDAWTIEFNLGFAFSASKTFGNSARAVRGGL